MKYLGPSQSGSFAGDTASRNRYGQYIRRRAMPVQPRTADQLNVRARLAANAAGWRSLSDADKAGWTSLGLQMQRTDSLGQVYTLNGFAAYVSVSNNLAAAGDSVVDEAPALITPDAPAAVTLTATGGGSPALSVAYTPTPLGTGVRAFIWASPQLSAGVSYVADYRLIAVTAAAAASPANILAAYTAKFGVPLTGNRISVMVQLYNGGFLSTPAADTAVAT